MKLRKHPLAEHRYVFTAFITPVLLFFAVYALWKIRPFGSYSLLFSDEMYQYCPFFINFRKALLSGDSLLWNWSFGMGVDYLAIISYYLASPLNLFSIILPEEWMLTYFGLLAPIKIGLASAFFAIMLKKLYGQSNDGLALFGCFYGLCAWATGYHWNVMWLDAFALLPLVILGTVNLLQDRKYLLYTVSLFLCVLSNYYIGFFVCIFVLLFFFCYEYCRFSGMRQFFSDLGSMALFTVLAIGATAFLELPGILALQNTYSSIEQFPSEFSLNIASQELVDSAKAAWDAYASAKATGDGALLHLGKALIASIAALGDAMQKIAGNLGGGTETTFKDGLPNIYCGSFAIALGFLFLMNPNIARRDKRCCVGLLIFFCLSFTVLQLDYIWHGFHYPKAIPHRFSFLFSFVMLYMAYRGWIRRHDYSLRQFCAAGILSILLILWGGNGNSGYLVWNIVFLVLYLAFMGYYSLVHKIQKSKDLQSQKAQPAAIEESPAEERKPDAPQPDHFKLQFPSLATQKMFAATCFCGLMVLELLLNVANMMIHYPSAIRANYPWSKDEVIEEIQKAESMNDENAFYRSELTHTFAINDGALYGYNGISTFTSTANAKVTAFLHQLGLTAKTNHNQYRYEETSPVANLFLNVKYMYERNGGSRENSYFNELDSSGDVILLENNAYLPLGFLAESALADKQLFDTERGFPLQNALFRAATGCDADIWTYEPDSTITVTYDKQMDLTAQAHSEYYYKANGEYGTITYTIQTTQEGLLCFDITLPYVGVRFDVYKVKQTEAGAEDVLLYDEQYIDRQILSVCETKPGDLYKIVISFEEGKDGQTDGQVAIKPAVADKQAFQEGFAVLRFSTLSLTEFQNDYVAGEIDCNRDGLLYTSIPQDGNWTAYLDGKQVLDPVLVGDVMLAIPVTEGIHIVEFRYRNPAFEIGAAVSGLCFLILAGIICMDINKKTPKGGKKL